MKKIENKTDYINEGLLSNKHLYFKKETKDNILYYIVKCESILSNNPLKYKCSKGFCFSISKNFDKCYLYDDKLVVEPNYKDDLYIMSFTEFVDTFRSFVENDGKHKSELPSKLIQDK